MSQKNQIDQTVKDKTFAEDDVDKQLKDAGLWEEGLTLSEKQQFLNFIKESENCAKEEEIKRKHKCDSIPSGQKTVIHFQAEVSEVSKVLQKPISEDSEPIITFESPATINRRKALQSPSSSPPEFSNSKSNINKQAAEEEAKESPGTLGLSPNKINELEKLHPVVFANSSLTIQYVPTQPNSSEDIVVSETDEESDNNGDPLGLGQKIVNSSTSIVEEKAKAFSGKSSIEIISSNSCQSNTPNGSRQSDSLLGSNAGKYLLNRSAVEKAVFHSIPSENLVKTSGVNSLHSKESIETADIVSSYGAEIHYSKATNSESPLLTEDKDSRSQRCNRALFSTDISEDIPLQARIGILSEKLSQAYFKVPHETDAMCVKRIYSLITGWQSSLAQYQRKLLKPMKWGPPITVDRQIKNDLLKKSYLNNLSKSVAKAPYADMSSSSSDSEMLLSDETDEIFNIFPRKKRKNGRKVKKSLFSQQVANMITGKHGKKSCKEDKVVNGGNEAQNEREGSPSISSIIQNNIEMESSPEDDAETESQTPRSRNVGTSIALKTTMCRKSFALLPLEEEPESATHEQSSPEINATQPNPLVKSTTKSQNNHPPIDMVPETVAGSSLTSCNTQPNLLTRNSMKRKTSPSPLSTPPLKKTATSSNQDSQEEEDKIIIKPTSIRLKNLLSRNIRKNADSKKSSDQETSETTDLKATPPTTQPGPSKEKKSSPLKWTPNIPQSEQDNPAASTEDVSGERIPQPVEEMSSQREASMECPLCQEMFSFSEIQAHASECNGPPEPMTTRSHPARGRRPVGVSRAEETDVRYVETLKHSTHHSRK